MERTLAQYWPGCGPQLVKVDKAGLTNAYNWLVYFTFFLGTYFFTVGCFLISVAAVNGDEVMGLQDIKRYRHYRFFAWQPQSKAWWGGAVYTAGALLYNVRTLPPTTRRLQEREARLARPGPKHHVFVQLGATANLADQFPAVQLSPTAEVGVCGCLACMRGPDQAASWVLWLLQLWLKDISFLVGGIGFLAGGWLLVAEREGWNILTGKSTFCSYQCLPASDDVTTCLVSTGTPSLIQQEAGPVVWMEMRRVSKQDCTKTIPTIPCILSPGVLWPFRKSDWRSYTWWINWWNFWGGFLFCFSGFFLPFTISPAILAAENAIGFGGGSLCFTFAGFLSFMKLSRAYHWPAQTPNLALTPRSEKQNGVV